MSGTVGMVFWKFQTLYYFFFKWNLEELAIFGKKTNKKKNKQKNKNLK